MHIWGIELETAFLLFAVSFPLVLAFYVYSHYCRYGLFAGWPALLTTAQPVLCPGEYANHNPAFAHPWRDSRRGRRSYK